uniref:Uncharacterized protein n=1 Tax=Parascaris univalens TaxID=6257 RepID=A0A915CAG0_PARUN
CSQRARALQRYIESYRSFDCQSVLTLSFQRAIQLHLFYVAMQSVIYLIGITYLCAALSLRFCCSWTCCCSLCTPQMCMQPDQAGHQCRCQNTTTVICVFPFESEVQNPFAPNVEDGTQNSDTRQSTSMQASPTLSTTRPEIVSKPIYRVPLSTTSESATCCSSSTCPYRSTCIPNFFPEHEKVFTLTKLAIPIPILIAVFILLLLIIVTSICLCVVCFNQHRYANEEINRRDRRR